MIRVRDSGDNRPLPLKIVEMPSFYLLWVLRGYLVSGKMDLYDIADGFYSAFLSFLLANSETSTSVQALYASVPPQTPKPQAPKP